MKLITKFTLIIAGVVITIFILTAFSVFSHYEKSIKETVAQQQFLMISMLADELDNKIATAHQLLIAAAKTIPPDAMLNPAKAQEFLDGKYGMHTVFDNHLFLLTPSGKIFAESADIGRRGFDVHFRDYITSTIKTKKPYISDPYASTQPHRHPVIMLTVPLFGPKGEITGIFSGSIDLMRDNFLGRMSTVKIGKTGYLYMTTVDRTLIMHPDRKRILTKLAAGSNKLYDRAIEGFEGSDDTTTSDGIKMVSSCKRLKTKNWILAANYPAAEAYRPIRQAKQFFLIATIIVISAVFLIISFLIKSLLKPLELFTRHIEGLPQKTGADRLFGINTEDEIGKLSVAFNKMVAEIESKGAALQQSEELYRTVTEFSADLVFWIAPDNKVIYVSQNCEEFSGYAQEEFYSSPDILQIIIHPDDRPIWAEHTLHLDKDGTHEKLELRMVTKSGQVRWIAHNCLPVYDKEGNYKGRRGSHQDITERKEAEDILRHLAVRDGLTGLANRHAFDEFFHKEWRRALRGENEISIMMIDVDFFKKYNDTYGHLKGDECLKQVANKLKQDARRSGDMAARFGGEEFVIISSALEPEKIISYAEKIRRDVEGINIPHETSGISDYVTVSIGVATILPRQNMSSVSLIQYADKALYKAKEEGRNRIFLYNGV